MVCRNCYRGTVLYHVTWRSPDGAIDSANRCQSCYEDLLKGMPPFPETYPDLIVTLVLLALDMLLACIAALLWFDIRGLTSRLVFVAFVTSLLGGTLINVQMILLRRVRRKSRPMTVIAAEKLKCGFPHADLWDLELDG